MKYTLVMVACVFLVACGIFLYCKGANGYVVQSSSIINLHTVGIRLPQFAPSGLLNARTFNTSMALFQDNLIFASRVGNLYYNIYEAKGKLANESDIVVWMFRKEGIGQCRVVAEHPKDMCPNIVGYEDPRIVINQGTITLIATSYLIRPPNRIPYPFIITLDVEKAIHELTLSSKSGYMRNIVAEKIYGPFALECTSCPEKNWSPLFHQDVTYFIQSIQPLVMLMLQEGVMTLVPTEKNSHIPNALKNFHLRGGSPAFPWKKDRYLLVGHVLETSTASYLSFFYEMSTNPFRITRYSNPFKLENERIEYLTGLVAFENEVWLSGGVEDRDSVLWKLSRDHVDSLMNGANGIEG